jgi:hypothetical protein
MRSLLFAALLLSTTAASAGEPASASRLRVKPEAFKTLVNPDCSHCRDEAKRRAKELRDDDRVLCWIRDTKGHYNGGAVPIRFFLNPYRVISDSYGVFVYDPDAGFARGFTPSYDFSFHGWRNGVMVMKHKDGTLYSCLTGLAFDGPGKGKRLQPVPTIVSNWGYWLKHYPDSVAYHMYDKYQPLALPTTANSDSLATRIPPNIRLPADEMVLGVFDGIRARAFRVAHLKSIGLIKEDYGGSPLVVIWEQTTATAAAYRPIASPPAGASDPSRRLTLFRDRNSDGNPLMDKETGSRWDITGRAVAGSLKGWTLQWVDATQVKWLAWAAEYPHTSIYEGALNPWLRTEPATLPTATLGTNAEPKPLIAVLTDVDSVNPANIATWKSEGFQAVAIVLDDNQHADALKSAAQAIASNSLGLYYWIEVARSPTLARDHPEWIASLGMHPDWRTRFPTVQPDAKNEVMKAWPWVPICYREAFDAHLARIRRLLTRAPAGYQGVLLNDLQAGPASCGCGNLQCRWAVDYGVPSTATKLTGSDIAARFLAEVAASAKGKEVIPVWTTECEQEDLPAEKRPAKGWSTGYCGSVPCFSTCRQRFNDQWKALTAGRRGPVALLLLHREFQRDRKEYGDTASWITHVMDYVDNPDGRALPHQQLWLVVQGHDVTKEEEAAARAVALSTRPRAVLVARSRIDQSYEPRSVKLKSAPVLQPHSAAPGEPHRR